MPITQHNTGMVHIYGTEWVSHGEPETVWLINSVGGVPIELVIMDENSIPLESTKRQFTIGGIVNNVRSTEHKQCWFRCTKPTDIGLLHLRPYKLGPYNELTELKASIFDIDAQISRLTRRMTNNEIQANSNTLRIKMHEYLLQGLQGRIGHLIAEFAKMHLRISNSAIRTKKYVSKKVINVDLAARSASALAGSLVTYTQLIVNELSSKTAEVYQKSQKDENYAYSTTSLYSDVEHVATHMFYGIDGVDLDTLELKTQMEDYLFDNGAHHLLFHFLDLLAYIRLEFDIDRTKALVTPAFKDRYINMLLDVITTTLLRLRIGPVIVEGVGIHTPSILSPINNQTIKLPFLFEGTPFEEG